VVDHLHIFIFGSSTTAVVTTAASRAVEFDVEGIVGRATEASAIFKKVPLMVVTDHKNTSRIHNSRGNSNVNPRSRKD